MRDAVLKAVAAADVLIMAAAVADYRPATVTEGKIKREADTLNLELVKTSDILGEVKGDIIKVGFAAESGDLIARATEKLRKKQLDLIVVNDITAKDSGFDTDTNRVTFIGRDGKAEQLPLMLKSEVAHKILDRVVGTPRTLMQISSQLADPKQFNAHPKIDATCTRCYHIFPW